jgi:hypothetical protein
MLVLARLDHYELLKMKALVPAVVFFATSVLMSVLMIGAVVALSIYRLQTADASIGTSQILILLSVRPQSYSLARRARLMYSCQVSGLLRLCWVVPSRCSTR